ncbi:MAG: DUF4157 domain-containing protein [Ruminococcus flavefaciens]|nr:DUF4157 domain-containing protein [Ruminococcus flavefaciens]
MSDRLKQEFLRKYLEKILLYCQNGNPFEGQRNYKKGDSESNTEYKNTETRIFRDPTKDRVFPVDKEALLEFNEKTSSNIEHAMVHLGSYSDEFTRTMHAAALTIASDIYFRSKDYRPETEEGRKLIVHELMHVAQMKEGILAGEKTTEELEREAEEAEKTVAYDPDPLIEFKIEGDAYRMRKSQKKIFMQKLEWKFMEWLEDQEMNMREEDYLKLMVRVKEKIDRGEMAWQQ